MSRHALWKLQIEREAVGVFNHERSHVATDAPPGLDRDLGHPAGNRRAQGRGTVARSSRKREQAPVFGNRRLGAGQRCARLVGTRPGNHAFAGEQRKPFCAGTFKSEIGLRALHFGTELNGLGSPDNGQRLAPHDLFAF